MEYFSLTITYVLVYLLVFAQLTVSATLSPWLWQITEAHKVEVQQLTEAAANSCQHSSELQQQLTLLTEATSQQHQQKLQQLNAANTDLKKQLQDAARHHLKLSNEKDQLEGDHKQKLEEITQRNSLATSEFENSLKTKDAEIEEVKLEIQTMVSDKESVLQEGALQATKSIQATEHQLLECRTQLEEVSKENEGLTIQLEAATRGRDTAGSDKDTLAKLQDEKAQVLQAKEKLVKEMEKLVQEREQLVLANSQFNSQYQELTKEVSNYATLRRAI